jgi:hypothetical protein
MAAPGAGGARTAREPFTRAALDSDKARTPRMLAVGDVVVLQRGDLRGTVRTSARPHDAKAPSLAQYCFDLVLLIYMILLTAVQRWLWASAHALVDLHLCRFILHVWQTQLL